MFDPFVMTKQAIAISRGDEEYDALTPAETVAAKRGLVVHYPEANELQIDIDSEEQYEEFDRRLCAVSGFEVLGYPLKVVVNPSASGLPNRHVTIRCEKNFTNAERLMWQAALNDDPFRVFLNAIRLADGQDNPSRFFEKPDSDLGL